MFLTPTDDSTRLFLERDITGPVTMLNLLRYRSEADYSSHPDLAPAEPITGREAYGLYAAHTLPLVAAAGAEVRFMGAGGPNLIGPPDEQWDQVLLVRYPNVQAFLGMAGSEEYAANSGHRTAALEDSRLIPIVE